MIVQTFLLPHCCVVYTLILFLGDSHQFKNKKKRGGNQYNLLFHIPKKTGVYFYRPSNTCSSSSSFIFSLFEEDGTKSVSLFCWAAANYTCTPAALYAASPSTQKYYNRLIIEHRCFFFFFVLHADDDVGPPSAKSSTSCGMTRETLVDFMRW